ncbi:MAG: putative TonB-dependent receptor [Rhodospirillales bacterium]|nr:putative TonB-dependent receptor [Rhodospirillales bacterium]
MSARWLMLPGATAMILATAGFGQGALAQAADQPAASVGEGLEEVVVTARRREEKLQSVPIAVTVFTAQSLQEKSIETLSDLQHYTPSLEVREQSRDEQNFFLRGQGQNGTAGAYPGVVSYFSEVPYIITGAGNLIDMESVQVLRGPQGTLFGRNTTGGAVLFEPKKPGNDLEGYVQATFGDYNREGGEAAVNIPIIQDKLLVRIAGAHEVRDGFTKNITTGQDQDNRDYWSGRAYVVFRPFDNFENDVIYSSLYTHTNGVGIIFDAFNPNTDRSKPATSFVPLFGLAAANAALALQQQIGPRQTASQVPGLGKTYHWGIIDRAILDITDELTFKNIASIQDMRNLVRYGFTGTALKSLALISKQDWATSWEEYTEEAQLQGKALGGNLSWTAGAYLEYLHPDGQSQTLQQVSPAISLITGASPVNSNGPSNQSARSQAVYAQGTYDLGNYIEGLKFTAGYRYTWDYRSISTFAYIPLPNNGRVCTQLGGNVAGRCYLNLGAPFSDPSWTLSLDYQVAPDMLIYVTGRHGYKSGGFNGLAPTLALVKYGSERTTDVEIGIKSQWEIAGMKIRANADLFHDALGNSQRSTSIQAPLPGGSSVTQTIVANGDATVEGFEFEGTIIPFAGLELSATYSHDYANYDRFFIPTVGNLAGLPYPATPRNKISLTGRYHLPLDPTWGDVSFVASASHQTHEQFATDNSPFGDRPGYTLLDLRLDWNSIMESTFDASFFVTNVTDKVYTLGITDLYNTSGTVSEVLGEPRMFGVQLKYRFGGPSEAEETATAYVPPPVVAPAPSVPKSYLVFFDFNKSDLTSQALTIVDQAAHNAGPAKVTKLEVTGHTDTVGSDAYNMRLSRRRAESVAAQLEKDGIPSSEIEIIAKGKRDLLVPTADGVKEPQNRRVQIAYEGGANS